MEETKCYRWAQQQLIEISISLDFHHYVNNVVALVRPKRYNGVCSRDQPRVRQHYEYRWFWSDWMIAHTPIKGWIKMIGPLTDHEGQSMKYQLSSTHTQDIPYNELYRTSFYLPALQVDA